MVYYRNRQPEDPPLLDSGRGKSAEKPLGGQLVRKYTDEQTQRSDKRLLDSGYLSDCAVICGSTKWATHRVILCSRNKWFRAALDGSFQEASTGIVTINDFDPHAIQAVLDYIYTGAINTWCSTPAKIIEVWKAGDFFGIHHLIDKAERSLKERLLNSTEILTYHPPPHPRIAKYTHCAEGDQVKYDDCNHTRRVARSCPVKNVQPTTIFHLCEPQNIIHQKGACKFRCPVRLEILARLLYPPSPIRAPSEPESEPQQPQRDAKQQQHGAGPVRPSTPENPGRRPTMLERWRPMYEEEIRVLAEALVVATADTPRGSSVQKMLMRHFCHTRLVAWDGFTLCRFLEAEV